jgi:hypothetical protein
MNRWLSGAANGRNWRKMKLNDESTTEYNAFWWAQELQEHSR